MLRFLRQCRFLGSCCSSFWSRGSFSQWFVFGKVDQDRRCYKDGRICTGYNTYQHRKSESFGYLATYQEQDQDGKEHREGRHYGTAQCIGDRFIEDDGFFYIMHGMTVLANTVVHDHRIVHRENDHSQYRWKKVLVNFKRERQYIFQEKEYCQ